VADVPYVCLKEPAVAKAFYNGYMGTILPLAALAFSLSLISTDQAGSAAPKPSQMDPEILISILPPAELKIKMAEPATTIDHHSEVSRTGPVTVVIRTNSCEKEPSGECRVNADVVVYEPDGSIHQQAKVLELPQGRGVLALTLGAEAPTGLYRVVANIRDMVARRFGTAERRFGVT
jgi:hypothetical protein